MEDIAERLGVSKRTLYLYFKSKEDLFKAICTETPRAIRELLQAPTFQQAMQKGGFGHACKVFFDISTKGQISGLSYELIAASARDPALRKIVRELYDTQIDVIADFLEDMKKAGDLPRNANTPRLARALNALYDGLVADLVIGMDRSEVRQTWADAADLIMQNPSPKRTRT